MIRMLLLFYKRASYLTVHTVECLSAMLDLSTLPLTPVEHSQATRFLEHDRLARQAIQATNLVFYVGKVPLENVTEYKYLGCPLSADDSDNAAVSLNISKATQTWFRMYHTLSSDGADSKTMACFYLAMVQAKLLYGSKTWVLSRHLLNCLECFHARCAC